MPIWILYAFGAALFASLVAVFGKIGITKIDTTLATTVRAVIMAVFLVVVSISLGKWPLLKTLHSNALLYIIFSGLAGALSWLFYFYALRNGPTSGVVALDKLSVVFALVLAILFLGEAFTWKSGIGAGLITVGAILMSLK